jgi:D-3-phosphoglycerate dehydrogenase / 2-oxoglutarate reductase
VTERRVLVTTVPFGAVDPLPLELLRAAGVSFVVNPLGRKLKPQEAAEMVREFEVVIAGTEPITDEVLANAPRLECICRVGVGLDSVDLLAARRRGVTVAYTPEAPAPAVAELTIGLMIDTLRRVTLTDRQLRSGNWQRNSGQRLATSTVGIVGLGRIGKRVVKLLSSFGAQVAAADVAIDREFVEEHDIAVMSFDRLLAECDVVSLHVPLTGSTENLVGERELNLMKRSAVLVNTSRGGVVNEDDLAKALQAERIAGAAMDVFRDEPYAGPLTGVDRCVLTAHMGSMSEDCRARMEIEATEEAIRYIRGEALLQPVPADEYEAREIALRSR